MPSTRRQNVYISFRAAKVNPFGQLAKLFALFLLFVACFFTNGQCLSATEDA